MIESQKDIPEDVIRLQQAWIKAINRVAEAMANRYRHDVLDTADAKTGIQSVIESIIALYCLLVDYGEATVLSDVEVWKDEHAADFAQMESEMKMMNLYRRWFRFMVHTMNKYGLLFDTMPKGYSNVQMESV